jgi:peroxiredoxin
MKRSIQQRVIIMTLLAATMTGVVFMPALSQVPARATTTPGMKLQGLDGRVFDLNDLHGNVVLVSFGATWCSPCTAELKALGELLLEYRGQPVKFYWVSIEGAEQVTNGKLKQYAKERKVTFPVLRDTGKMVFNQFSQRVRLPMIVLLRKDGRVDTPVQFGMNSQVSVYKSDLRARLNKLLGASSDSEGR